MSDSLKKIEPDLSFLLRRLSSSSGSTMNPYPFPGHLARYFSTYPCFTEVSANSMAVAAHRLPLLDTSNVNRTETPTCSRRI